MIHKYLSNGMNGFETESGCPLCKYCRSEKNEQDTTCNICSICIVRGHSSSVKCIDMYSSKLTKHKQDYTIRLFFWCLMWDHVNQQPPVFFSKLSNIRQLSATLDIRAVDTYKMYKSSGVDWKHEFVIKAVEILKN